MEKLIKDNSQITFLFKKNLEKYTYGIPNVIPYLFILRHKNILHFYKI